MKKHLLLAAGLLFIFASVSFAQPKTTPSPSPKPAMSKPRPAMSKAQLLRKLSASETKLWEAWKNKDGQPFKAMLSADSVMIGEGGVAGKDASIKEITGMGCEVKSYKLSDWKLTSINSGAWIVTYKGTAEGTCGGMAIPATWASSVWANRGGKWRVVSHQETPVTAAK